MKRTAEQFKEQVAKLGIDFWFIHSCSMCGYWCGFVFRDGEAGYDNGCDCGGGQQINPRTWEDVAYQYNLQSSPDVIKKYDEFWGFDPTKAGEKDE